MTDQTNDDMSFKQAYAILETNAEKLKSDNHDVDIDELVTIMEQSQKAYEICQQRIEAVKKTIERFASDSDNTAEPETSTDNHTDNSC
jgi:exodeoxyribonuclease VII small subunit